MKAIIFDHDGLMVNSEEVIYQAVAQVMSRHEQPFEWSYYAKHIGLPVKDSLISYYKDHSLKVSFEEFVRQRDASVKELIATDLKLMPDLRRLLRFLKQESITMAIATSAKQEYLFNNLDRFGIRAFFQSTVCIEDVDRGKPHPDLYLKALAETKTLPNNAVVLEDAPNGVEAAKQAGIYCIAIPTRGIPIKFFHKADLICNTLKQAQIAIDSLIRN